MLSAVKFKLSWPDVFLRKDPKECVWRELG